ncbi:MAG: peroxide stress protein YaaA [Pseudomonadales bacterium]
MLAILSPAKSLDFDTPPTTKKHSTPQFIAESEQLIKQLRRFSSEQLGELMGISTKLADLNRDRYANWQNRFNRGNAKPAVLAFSGDVYLGLDAAKFSARDFNWAQKHLRILSGLHGVLRPLDLIQPYRLEMGTQLKTGFGTDLYAFWGDRVTDELNATLEQLGQRYLINLASQEYFSVVQPERVEARIINVRFKDFSNGSYKFMSYYGKQARGLMASYMVKQRVTTLKALKAFDWQGYAFAPEQSSDNDWVFLRDKVPR